MERWPPMTVKATLTAGFPEARRIADFLDRDFAEDGGVVALVKTGPESWQVPSVLPAFSSIFHPFRSRADGIERKDNNQTTNQFHDTPQEKHG